MDKINCEIKLRLESNEKSPKDIIEYVKKLNKFEKNGRRGPPARPAAPGDPFFRRTGRLLRCYDAFSVIIRMTNSAPRVSTAPRSRQITAL